jgi:CBS domain-containing protein
MRISEIMTRPLVTCPVESTLDEVAKCMWEEDVGIVPLVDREGRVQGVITDRDVCMAAYTQGRRLSEIPAESAMSRQVLTCREHDDVEMVERVMREAQIRRVPVMDGERRPIGIIAINDLTRVAAQDKRGGFERELVGTLAAICAPRLESSRSRASRSVPVA